MTTEVRVRIPAGDLEALLNQADKGPVPADCTLHMEASYTNDRGNKMLYPLQPAIDTVQPLRHGTYRVEGGFYDELAGAISAGVPLANVSMFMVTVWRGEEWYTLNYFIDTSGP